MLAAWITLAHFSVSSAMSLPKSVGESASTSPPRSATRRLGDQVADRPSGDRNGARHREVVQSDQRLRSVVPWRTKPNGEQRIRHRQPKCRDGLLSAYA